MRIVLASRFLALALLLAAALPAEETLTGSLSNTFYLESKQGTYALQLRKDQTFRLMSPDGTISHGRFVFTDQELRLETGDLRRHFFYELADPCLTLRAAESDTRRSGNAVGEMPPGALGKAVFLNEKEWVKLGRASVMQQLAAATPPSDAGSTLPESGKSAGLNPQSEKPPPTLSLPPLKLRPAMDINKLTVAQYNGEVSAAMEAMRIVQWPMDAAETAKFEAQWATLFDFPTPEAVQYFNKLNPLLDEFLMLRGVIVQLSMAYDDAWAEARLAAGYESEDGTRAALALARQHADLLQSARLRLTILQLMIEALGDPPDAVQAKARARKKHDDAVAAVRNLGNEGKWYLKVDWDAPPAGWTARGYVVHYGPRGNRITPHFIPRGRTIYLRWKETYLLTIGQGKYGERETCGFNVSLVQKQYKNQMDFENDWRTDYPHIHDARYRSTSVGGFPGYDCSFQADWKDRMEHSFQRKIFVSKDLPPGLWVAMECQGTYYGTTEANETGEQARARFEREYPVRQASWEKSIAAMIDSLRFEIVDGVPPEEQELPPFVDENAPQTSPTATAGPSEAEKKKREEEAQAVQQKIEEHENNIRLIARNLAKNEEELAREKDPTRRAALEFRILTAKSDVQAEQDLIASLRTGRIVHTRTPFDDYAHKQFVQNIREEQQVLGGLLKAVETAQRMISRLPPSEQRPLREFADRQLSADAIANMDLGKSRKALQAIYAKVQGYYQGEGAKADEKAAWENFGVEAAENVKTAADWGMTITSLFGGEAINIAYQAGTGYIEGGRLEAVKRAATAWSNAIDYAVTGIEEGYKDGVWAGAQAVAIKYVQNKSLEWVAGKIMAKGKGDEYKPTWKEALDATRFKQEREWGEALVKDFQRAQAAIQQAGASGASPQEIVRLQAAARDRAAAVASSLHAKNYLKYKCDPFTGKAYDTHMRAIHAEVDANVRREMANRRWNTQDWEMQEFRNSASLGKPNMDRDVGLRERSLWELDANGQPCRGPDGRPVPNPERWQRNADGRMVPRPELTRDGQPMSLFQWQQEAQEIYNQAYRRVTGRSAPMAMEGVTTSVHPEAYKDLAWLGQDRSLVSAAWGPQAGDVSRYKIGAPEHADRASSYFTKMQEVARGTSKDMETKLLPLLQNARPKGSTPEAIRRNAEALAESVRHWRKINAVLQAYGQNEIDPIYAHRRIRELTGGKSIPEVVDEMAVMMEAVLKMGR